MEWVVIAREALVVLGSLSVVVVPWLARRLASRTGQVKEAEALAEKIAEGLKYVEAAVDAHKRSQPGDAGSVITRTIREYGPVAAAAVDRARALAHALAEEAWKAREAELIAREHEARKRELAERAAAKASR